MASLDNPFFSWTEQQCLSQIAAIQNAGVWKLDFGLDTGSGMIECPVAKSKS